MCPLRLIARLFLFDEAAVPAELRAQRAINRARIPEIARYMVQNQRGYTFSAITASIDSRVQFTPLKEQDAEGRVGSLQVPMEAKLVINDGQHRKAAIQEALKMKPELGHETIPVVLFVDAGLKRSQQMFADLNKYAVRPSRSLGVLYDHRDPLAGLVRELLVKIPLFADRIEKEKTTISHRSVKLFTLSSVYQATKALLGKRKKQDPVSPFDFELAAQFWTELPKCIPEWTLLLQGNITSAELRKRYVHAHGVGLQSLGVAGNSLIANNPTKWKSMLGELRAINWLKNNRDWKGRAIVNGRLSKAQTNVILTTSYIKRRLGLSLTEEENRIEKQFARHRVGDASGN
jgi:DNA sulfur modification protein DndB